jgi:hypothetical protein
MKNILYKSPIVLLILFTIIFFGSSVAFANYTSIIAPLENQILLAGSVFDVEYDIDLSRFEKFKQDKVTCKLYFSANEGIDWDFVNDINPNENIYKWSVPSVLISNAQLKIYTIVYIADDPPIMSYMVPFTKISGKFKISKMLIDPIKPTLPIDPDILRVKPNPPTDLIAEAISSGRIEINWADQSSNELGFRIERRTESGKFTEIEGVAADTTNFIDNNLVPKTTYFYRVLAYNSKGESTYSNTESTKTESLKHEEEETEPIIMKFYIDNTDYYVDGQIKTMDAAPIILESRTVLPIRYVVEPLGGDVYWDNLDKRVDIALGGRVINLWIENNIASVNSTMIFIDPNNSKVMPIIVPPGRTMLPLRFIAESLGARVMWDAPTKQVTITYPAP